MSPCNIVLTGIKRGLMLGFPLIFFMDVSDAMSNLTSSESWFLTIFILILCGLMGGIVALINLGAIKALSFLNWISAALLGSILGTFTILWSSLLGWISIVLIPILLLARKYFSEKLPKWIENSIDQAIITFLAQVFLSCFIWLFTSATGVKLVGI
ncbi:hypothetical protein QM565_34280 [Geitlerinema splendidum]|nr:hypothetical protein [Geitlerinema splendidum]